MDFEELINERTYKIVLLTSFLNKLQQWGNTVIAVRHYNEMQKYFAKEAIELGIPVHESNEYMHTYIVKILGCDYTVEYFKPNDKELTEAGTEMCYVLRAVSDKRNDFLWKKKNKFIVNIDILNDKDELLERPKILGAYRDLLDELKGAIHCINIDIVGLTDFNYSTIDTGISLNKLGQNHIEYVTEKIEENSNYNIFAINTRLKFKKKSKIWTAYDFVRDAQNRGLIL